MEYIDKILTPETLGFGAAVAALLLARSKFFTERDYKRARDLLDMGHSVAEIAGKTQLKIHQIQGELKDNDSESSLMKMIQRKGRKAIRGWF